MNKKILLCFCLNLYPVNVSPAENNILIGCEKFNITELLLKMKDNSEFNVDNPFSDNCVQFIIGNVKKPKLNLEDFNGHKMLYEYYLKSVNDPEMHVKPLYDTKNGNYYHFLRFNENDNAFKLMKKQWLQNNNTMELYFDDFIKLHELSHLSPDIDKNLKTQEKETLADISAIYILSFKKQFTVNETIQFLESVRSLRKKDNRKGYLDINGKLVKDKKHLNDKIFFNALKDLKSIKDKNKLLNNTEEFKNLKLENIPKLIRTKYKSKK